MNRCRIIFCIILSFVFFATKLSAFKDSLKTVKVPKHYFHKTFYIDSYSLGKIDLDTLNPIAKKLGTYQARQTTFGFNIPLATKNFYNKDSTRISNLHFLLTGSYNRVNLSLGDMKTHYLVKSSLGFRTMFNNGKKSIFFMEIAPFVTKDIGHPRARTYRLATTLLYDCSVSSNFSFRVGVTRTFLWGNRYVLPYIGLRVGRLDKVNFSVQFPRSISFNVPIGKYIRTCLYTKPMGGLYSYANTDSLTIGDSLRNDKLFFGRSEFLTGLRIDVLPSRKFNFYISSGFATNNQIAFFPTSKPKNDLSLYSSYYAEKIKSTIFVNFGFVIRFGKTRSFYNSQQMYNAMDLNNSTGVGDNNVRPGNGNIPAPAKKIHKTTPNEVLDLIETQDFY